MRILPLIAISATGIGFSATAQAQIAPIEAGGWNRDVIQTNGGTQSVSMFDGEGFAWYANGYLGGTNGFAANGAYTLADGDKYQFQNYNYDNVLWNNSATASTTLTITDPAEYSSIGVLAVSADGGGNATGTLNYTDGTSTAFTISAPDWSNTGTAPLTGLQRTVASGFSGGLQGTSFGVTESTVTVNAAKTLASISFAKSSGGETGIFALSGTYAGVGAGPSTVTSINQSSAVTGAGFTANGTAKFTSDSAGSNVLQLTTATNGQTGSAFSNSLLNVGSGFNASFKFLMSNSGGNPADGLTFTLQNGSPTAIGGGGGAFGEEGLNAQGLALTFNAYNATAAGESVVGLDIDGVNSSTATATGFSFYNGGLVSVNVSYLGSTLTEVITQGANSLTETYNNVNLSSIMGGNLAYAGFTGATGGANMQQDITGFAITSSSAPEPAALALLPIGLVAFHGMRRRSKRS